LGFGGHKTGFTGENAAQAHIPQVLYPRWIDASVVRDRELQFGSTRVLMEKVKERFCTKEFPSSGHCRDSKSWEPRDSLRMSARILLRNRETGEYYAGGAGWVGDRAAALTFERVETAFELAQNQKLADLEVVLKYEDPDCDLVLPVRQVW
jgi:hypothetical protein